MNPIFAKLSAHFAPTEVEWRVGSTTKDRTKGMALCYIDARAVQQRLDDAVSPGGWQCTFEETPKGRLLCRLSIKVEGEWITKTDGAGDTDYEAEKGAISSALKRAAVLWGVGRYLYDIPATWVEIEGEAKRERIKKSEYGKLQKILPAKIVEADETDTPPPKPKADSPQTTHGSASKPSGAAESGGTSGSGKKRLAGFFERPSYTISWPESTDKKPLTIEEQCASWLGHWTAVIDKLDSADEWMKLSVDNADMLQMLKRGAEKMHVAAVSAHKDAGKKFDPNRIPLVGG